MLVVSQRFRKRQPLQEEPRGAAASPWTWCVRVALVVAGAAAVAAPRVADAAVARCWAYVLSFRIAHHCLFEASLATWGFFQAIAFFQLLDSLGSVSRRWRFDGAAPVPYGRSSDSQRGGLEAFVYLGGVLAFHAVKRKAPLAVEPPTLGRVAGEVTAGIVAYDLLFYWIHRFFHWKGAPSLRGGLDARLRLAGLTSAPLCVLESDQRSREFGLARVTERGRPTREGWKRSRATRAGSRWAAAASPSSRPGGGGAGSG